MPHNAVVMIKRSLWHCVFSAVSLLIALSARGQEERNLIKTFFTDGKISTLLTRLSNDLDRGNAIAFDHAGNEIYRMEVRRYAGHANVEFKFHPNGAVYTAHYTSHPDGGIQWSDITHYFDDQGNVVRVEDNSSDDFGRPTLHILPEEKEMLQTPEKSNPENQTSQCAEVLQTKVFAVNKCKRKIRLRKVLPVAAALISSVIDSGHFTDIKPRVKPEFFLGRKQAFAEFVWSEPIIISKNVRHYILYVFE
jgi:hypothetical protein